MNIKDKLQQHLVMSMFATHEDLFEEMNKQREEALARILELEQENEELHCEVSELLTTLGY